jgi:hypothetical protein
MDIESVTKYTTAVTHVKKCMIRVPLKTGDFQTFLSVKNVFSEFWTRSKRREGMGTKKKSIRMVGS